MAGRFQPGQSGNPNGRPPKDRALTAILARAGNAKIAHNGQQVARKQLLAQLLWDAAVEGKITLFDIERPLGVDEWIDIVQFLYRHIDGPPPTKLEHDGQIASIQMTVDQWRAEQQKSQQQATQALADFEDDTQ